MAPLSADHSPSKVPVGLLFTPDHGAHGLDVQGANPAAMGAAERVTTAPDWAALPRALRAEHPQASLSRSRAGGIISTVGAGAEALFGKGWTGEVKPLMGSVGNVSRRQLKDKEDALRLHAVVGPWSGRVMHSAAYHTAQPTGCGAETHNQASGTRDPRCCAGANRGSACGWQLCGCAGVCRRAHALIRSAAETLKSSNFLTEDAAVSPCHA